MNRRIDRIARPRGQAWRLVALLPLGILLACGGGGDAASEDDTAADAYTVRGIIEKLPQTEGHDKSLYIRHAPIPDYRNERGETVGMQAMTMPFPLADGVSLGRVVVREAPQEIAQVLVAPGQVRLVRRNIGEPFHQRLLHLDGRIIFHSRRVRRTEFLQQIPQVVVASGQ